MAHPSTRPLRLLVDSYADEGFTNAQMSNAREIIARLDPQRFHVSVFLLNQPDPRILSRPNTTLIKLPPRRQTFGILRQFIFGNFDIIFYLKASPAAKLYLGCRKWWRDRRVVIGTVESQANVHQEPTVVPASIKLWQSTILKSDYLFSNSLAVKESLQREYGLGSEVIATGVDSDFFTPSDAEAVNARVRVLFAGSLRPFKQPDKLIEAAAQFPEADFVIAGDGIMAADLRRSIQQKRLVNVTLTGPLNSANLRREYRRADIFLFPSRWEGSPKVILEAAACGLPVIARSNYLPETVLNNQTGFLVDSDEDLFHRLRTLVDNVELRIKFGLAAREHARNFDWKPITRQWEDVFLSVGNRAVQE